MELQTNLFSQQAKSLLPRPVTGQGPASGDPSRLAVTLALLDLPAVGRWAPDREQEDSLGSPEPRGLNPRAPPRRLQGLLQR